MVSRLRQWKGIFLFFFINKGDIRFGGLKTEVSLQVEIQQSHDMVVFGHLLWQAAVSFLINFNFILIGK